MSSLEELVEETDEAQWQDWKWQQRNALRRPEQVQELFPEFPDQRLEAIQEANRSFEMTVTPYTLSLVERDQDGNPLVNDPLWKQFIPTTPMTGDRKDAYAREHSNWELNEDFPTPILQHKYPSKALVRLTNVCLGYCNFCFEVERTTDKEVTKPTVNTKHWNDSLEYLRENDGIEEVILSGGDPLIHDNDVLEEKIADLRGIDSVDAIRIHTRSLTFNPYRIDDDFVNICKEYDVTELGLHVTHPRELTTEFNEALERFNKNGYGKIMKMAQIPLLRGINDDSETMRELCTTLYSDGQVKPYYLLHDMPWTPGASRYRTPVRKGVQIINDMKRDISNVAVPEYIIVHHDGKKQVPLDLEGTVNFRYTTDADGYPEIEFKNWKGEQVTYLDAADADR